MRFNVTAVVVSYNREQLLGECLDGLAVQTRPADRVIVVDNASTDHALQVAHEHPIDADVIALPHNVGGAGGFCAEGMQGGSGRPESRPRRSWHRPLRVDHGR